MTRLCSLILFAGLGGGLFALPEPDDIECNREKLAKWQRNPEQWSQLRKNAQLFQSLSAERQKQILDLDRTVHDRASANHLHQVMERYLVWMERLDEADRKRIREAPDTAAKLAIIAQLREQEWLKTQPKATREKLSALQGAERHKIFETLRQEERNKQRAWAGAAPFLRELDKSPLPARLVELPRDAQDFYNDYLKPRVPREEFDRLAKLEGQWPDYLKGLLEIAAKYPPALMTPEGPQSFKELPFEVQKRFRNKAAGKIEKIFEAKGGKGWPEYGIQVADFAYKRNIVLPFELWPTSFASLSAPVQEFVKKKLEPTLSEAELIRLKGQEGRWPEYPNEIAELAKKRNLTVPWLTYGGSLGRLATQ